MGTLPNQQIGNASVLYNLLRNVGGSIGISLSNTVVASISRCTGQAGATSRAGRLALEQRLQAMQQNVRPSGPVRARCARTESLSRRSQHRLLSGHIIDDFRYLALACFFLYPDRAFPEEGPRRGGPSMAH